MPMLCLMDAPNHKTPIAARVERRARQRPVNLYGRDDLFGLEIAEVGWDEWNLHYAPQNAQGAERHDPSSP